MAVVSPYHPALKRQDNSFALGSCDSRIRMIFISADVPEYKFKKVLCHEIVHAAMFSYQIELSYEEEEVVADLIATYGQEIIDITNRLFFNAVYK